MTAAMAQVRPAPRAARAVPLTTARLLRIELRRNAMPWILPLIGALFWFDSYRPSASQAPFWMMRTFWNMGQGHTIIDFGPFVAGVAAWMGSRDGRRGMGDLVTGTPSPPWVTQLATWAATAIWAVAAYLAFAGIMFAVYARQGVEGSPPWWWVAVGAVAVTAFSAAGFAVGVLLSSRFAAPLAAFGGFLALAMSSRTGFGSTSGWALILPTNSNGNFSFQQDSGIFYPYLPDLPIARIMFLAGLAVAALAMLGLPARAGGRRLRRTAAVVTLAGVAAAGTAVALATTARVGPQGTAIPALHDAANDRPIPYTPICEHAAGTSVCLNPAYARYLPELTAALGPVLAEVAGLPGAPSRATQIAATYTTAIEAGRQGLTISGRPPVLLLPLGTLNPPAIVGAITADFTRELRVLAVHAFLGAGVVAGTPAQQAVQAVLLQEAGIPLAQQPGVLALVALPQWGQATVLGLTDGRESAAGPGPATGSIYTAAQRFAALPAGQQRAWLAAHLAALRAGQLTLAQLP